VTRVSAGSAELLERLVDELTAKDALADKWREAFLSVPRDRFCLILCGDAGWTG
jgi:hypothetical protein